MLIEKRSIYKQSFHDELEKLAEQGQEQDVQEQSWRSRQGSNKGARFNQESRQHLWPGAAANAVGPATAWIKPCYPLLQVTKPWDLLTAN